MLCTRRHIVPLVKQLTDLKNVRVIWQETPPYPAQHPLDSYRITQNSYTQGAINYFIAEELRAVGVMIVPAWGLSLPWADEELSGRTHMMEAQGQELLTIPPGVVSSYYAMYLACSGDIVV